MATNSMTTNNRLQGMATFPIMPFIQKFGNDWTMNLANMLTYSLITTIFPILVGILTIAALILNVIPATSVSDVANSIQSSLPPELSKTVQVGPLVKNLKDNLGLLSLITFVGLVWTGSNLFTNIENAFSIIYRTRDRDFIPQRIMAICMVFVLAILLPLSLGASSLVTAGSQAFHSILPAPLGIVLSWIGPLASIGILWVLFLSIYIIVPNMTFEFRNAWRGALAAAILFTIFNILFPLYFQIFLQGNSQYGALAAAALVLVIWLWFFSVILLFGAQVNAVAMGLRPTQQDLAGIVAKEYYEQAIAPPPARTPRVLAVGSTACRVCVTMVRPFTGAMRLLARMLHALALLVWLVVRPAVKCRGVSRTPSNQ